MRIVAIDPAGNFIEGKGKTGIVVGEYKEQLKWPIIKEFTTIRAKNYKTKEDYYKAIIAYLFNSDTVVCEDFILYGNKAAILTGSRLETSKLIGALEMKSNELNIKFVLQKASLAKSRWPNELLMNHNLILKKGTGNIFNQENLGKNKILNNHILDAYRHLLYYCVFKIKKP